jgi:adenylylsulfate kinase
MSTIKATNITWHESHVQRQAREELLHQKGCTIWFTGLPSSGKSTTAFSAGDREENIRRIGEVARLFADAGVVTMTSFISPYRKDRQQARDLHDAAGVPFVEVFVDTPVDVCEARDPKGLYRRARLGEIKGFTGVDDPYEPPEGAEVVVRTAERSPAEIAAQLLDYLLERGILHAPRKG